MLPKLEGYAAARLGSLDAAGLATVAGELASLEQTVLGRADLRAVLTDTSIAAASRGLIVHDILDTKVHEVTCEIAEYAASHAPAQEVPHALGELAVAARELSQIGLFPLGGLGLLASRQRVSGFADAQFGPRRHRELRRDRGRTLPLGAHRRGQPRAAPPPARPRRPVGVAPRHRRGPAGWQGRRRHPAPSRCYVIEGGRSRDVVGTLDYLVDYVAKARDWRVARVHTARPLDDAEPRRPRRVALARSPARTSNSRSPTAPSCSAASWSRSATCASTRRRAGASARCATPSRPATCTNRL